LFQQENEQQIHVTDMRMLTI